jgi:hypothetical protein
MASRYAAVASRRNSPIDVPLAAAAALAVGFAAFVMPGDILTSLVQATGLPSVLPMAEPPLGMKARAGISLVAALLTFGSVFFLLRRIGGASAPARQRDTGGWLPEVDEVGDTSPAAPRLRRADVHPDAPARRPILAVRELGEPAPQMAPLPSFVAEMPAEPEAAPDPEPEPQAVVAIEEPPEELDELELTGSDIEIIAAAPEAAAPEQSLPAAVYEPTQDASVAELMARLERGLARRIRRPEPTPAPEAAREPVRDTEPVPIFQAGGDDRLRNAMENLQKMAARAG